MAKGKTKLQNIATGIPVQHSILSMTVLLFCVFTLWSNVFYCVMCIMYIIHYKTPF